MALLRIRKPDGEIVEIASLPGAKGEDGKTPEKGVDYFTPEEQEAFLASAKTYADEQDDLLEEKLNSAYAAANAYTDEKAALAEDNAKAYTDEQTATVEANAKDYTDEKAAEQAAQAENNANAYTDEKAALAEDNAKAYTDEQLGDIETALDGILAMQEALIGGDTE